MHGTRYCAVLCRAVLCRAVLLSWRHMRTVDFKLILCVKITWCASCRQVGDHVLSDVDLPARHRSDVSTNQWRRGSALRKGNLVEGEGGEVEEVAGCSSEMIQETTTVKIDSFHRIRQQPKRGLFYAHHTGLFFLLCSGGLKSSPILVLYLFITLLSLRLMAFQKRVDTISLQSLFVN